MPAEHARNVSLTAEPNAFILARVSSGQYQNASEVVRAALRLLQAQHERQERTRVRLTRDQVDAR